ncbi:MAG: hypothetical protein EXR14_01930 [Pelagibacteraceae bacterium]|nr:hypothetical protein [Pelagibacteraceae bacterium]PHX89709.1 MAG: hypothetical protein CK535_00335 [Pelagibacteraceae bacterium]
MSSKKAMKQAQKLGYAKHRSNFNNTKNLLHKPDLNKMSKDKKDQMKDKRIKNLNIQKNKFFT